jgi:AraC-like DNA-binding protein
VLPESTLRGAASNPLLKGLHPSHVGFFPNAKHHKIHRATGAAESIFKYCVKGTGWCEMDGQRFEVGPGDLLVVPAGVNHAYGAYEKRPWTIHWFHALGDHVPLLCAQLGVTPSHPVAYLGIDAPLIELFQELRLTLEDDYSPPRLLYSAQLLTYIFGRMIRRRGENQKELPDAGQRVLRSVDYIKQHLEEVLEVETLASVTNLSPSHYSTLFRQLMGCSPKNYAIRLRMRRAAQLLETTTFTIQTIARMLGYNDALYFSRSFRLIHEISPSEFRRKRLLVNSA